MRAPNVLAAITVLLILTLTLVFQLSRITEQTVRDPGFFSDSLDHLDVASTLSATTSVWLATDESPTALEQWLSQYLVSVLEEALEPHWVEQTKETTSRELAAYFGGEREDLVLMLTLTPLKNNMSRVIGNHLQTEWADWVSSLLLPAIPDQVRTEDLTAAYPIIQTTQRVSVFLASDILGWVLLVVLLLSLVCLAVHRLGALVYLTLPVAVAGWVFLITLPFLNNTAQLSLANADLGQTPQLRVLLFQMKDAILATTRHTAWQTALVGTVTVGLSLLIHGTAKFMTRRR